MCSGGVGGGSGGGGGGAGRCGGGGAIGGSCCCNCNYNCLISMQVFGCTEVSTKLSTLEENPILNTAQQYYSVQ